MLAVPRFPLVCAAFASLVLVAGAQVPQSPPAGGRGAMPLTGAWIAGTVKTSTGQPLNGATVRAVSRSAVIGSGEVRYIERLGTRTGPVGEYRLGPLGVGDYVIDVPLTHVTWPAAVIEASRGSASTSAAGSVTRRLADSFAPVSIAGGTPIGDQVFRTFSGMGTPLLPTPSSERLTSVPISTIYPNARLVADADIVSIQAAGEIRRDFTVPIAPAHAIRGRLTGALADVGYLGVRLLPVLNDRDLFADTTYELASTATDARGAFTFLGVPSGTYTLKVLYVPSGVPGPRGGGAPSVAAMASVRSAEAIVTVRDADVDGLEVALRPPLKVSGRFETTSQTVDYTTLTIMMLSNRPVIVAPPAPVAVNADGTFTFYAYGPGLYHIGFGSAAGYAISNVSVDGVNAPAPNRYVRVDDRGRDGIVATLTALPPRAGSRGNAPPPSAPDDGFIGGHVIDGATGEGVRGATVSLMPATTSQAASTASRRDVTSGDGGEFVFGAAAVGSYVVGATAPGYAPGNFGQVRPGGPPSTLGLRASERVGVMVIRVWKYGTISGRVVDDHGVPVAGLPVSAYFRQVAGEAVTFAGRSTATTDPLGRYSIAGLTPGHYVVCTTFTATTVPRSLVEESRRRSDSPGNAGSLEAELAESDAPRRVPAGTAIGTLQFSMATRGQTAALLPAPVGPDGAIRAYRTTCDLNAPRPVEALPIAVSGTTVPDVNLVVPTIATTRVSGVLENANGPIAHTGVHLLRAPAGHETMLNDLMEVGIAASDAAGAFTLLGVPPGRYVLRAYTTHVTGETPPTAAAPTARPAGRPHGITAWAQTDVTVPADGLTNVTLRMTPPARITGRLLFENAATPPATSGVSVALNGAAFADPPVPAPAPISSDGRFTLEGYAPRRYTVPEFTAGGWRVTSATFNGAPVTDLALDLSDGRGGELVLTLRNVFSEVTGAILDVPPGLSPIGTTVCIFPADYKAWIAQGMTSSRMRSFRPASNWTYRATWLPAGDYLAVVYPEADGDELSAAFVAKLASHAVPLSIGNLEKKALDLRLSAIK